jgi:hypothetical protein
MDYGCCRIASPVAIRLWIFGGSNDLEVGIRDWNIIQSCSVRSDRLVYERVVCNRFLLCFRSIDEFYPLDSIFDVKDKWYLINKLDYGTASSH